MISSIKKSLVIAGFAGVLGLAYAATTFGEGAKVQARSEQAVSATWALGTSDYEGVPAVVTPEGAVTTSTFDFGSDVSGKGKRTNGDMSYTTYLTNAGESDDYSNAYLSFRMTPAEAFTPTNVSFYICGAKTGDPKFQASLTVGGKTETIVPDTSMGEYKNSFNGSENNEKFKVNVPVSGFDATTDEVELRIYVYKKNGSTKNEVCFANVAIDGVFAGEEGGEEQPVAATFTMPGVHGINAETAAKIAGNDVRVNADGAMLDYVKNNGTATFSDVYCAEEGLYKVVLPLDNSYGTGTLRVEVKNAEGAVEAVYDGNLTKNNSKYEKIDFQLNGVVTKGAKTIVYTFGDDSRSFVCNVMAPEWVKTGDASDEPEVPADGKHIPGELSIINPIATYDTSTGISAPRAEDKGPNGSKNIGYLKHGSRVTFNNIECAIAGVYNLTLPFSYNSGGILEVTVKDNATGKVEVFTSHTFVKGDNEGAYPNREIPLEGEISEGSKTIAFHFLNEGNQGGWIGNFAAPTFTKVAEKAALINSVAVAEGEATESADYNYAFNLSKSYAGETAKITVNSINAVLTATAANAAGEVEVTAEGEGVFTIPTPEPNAETIVTFNVAGADENTVVFNDKFTVRVYRIGGVLLQSLTVDGREVSADVVAALNTDEAAATLAGTIYTAVPAVKATFVDGTSATAKVALEGTNATATFTGKAGADTKDYTFTIEGVHTYTAASTDEVVDIVYDGALCRDDNSWSNGLYTLYPVNDGWGGSQFKMSVSKNGPDLTWEVPADVKVKQFVFVQLGDNYAPGKVASVSSEGAEVWLPTASEFYTGGENRYDLVVNLDNHQAGQPIHFSFKDGNQPYAMFRFVIEKVAVEAPVTVKSTTLKQVNNHAAVTVNFSMEMQDVTATCNGETLTAEGGSSVLTFPVWNLPYNHTAHLVIEAGAAKDVYNNSNAEPIDIEIEIGDEPTATLIDDEHYIEVTNTAEFIAAIESVNSTNAAAGSERRVIFFRNGTYDLGGAEGSSVANGLLIMKAYNVSLIGESREGVLICGINNGISNPVFSTRNSSGTYFQDLTIRNSLDYGTSADKGQAVALYSGKKEVLVNVTLQGKQDTYVTGDQCYFYNCDIAGKVDFICGGGNHYFDACNLLIEAAGAKITAPNTTAAQKYGYVFQNCTIKAGTDGASKVNKQFALGRPWQNEPRAYFLNTIMEVQPYDAGWEKMGDLITHFYEYNSMDANGNVLDLSKRQNSPTSLNTYKPVLTDEEASKFTIENVLGGTESYHPADEALTHVLEAPDVKCDAALVFTWAPVKHAAGYAIYYKGELVERVSDCTYDTNTHMSKLRAENAETVVNPVKDYNVRAINSVGGMGEMSEVAIPTGIDGINADVDAAEEAVYYNVQGIRVSEDYRGVVVKVAADGTISKEVRK